MRGRERKYMKEHRTRILMDKGSFEVDGITWEYKITKKNKRYSYQTKMLWIDSPFVGVLNDLHART